VNRPEENGSQTVDPQSAENGEDQQHADKEKLNVPKDIFDFYEKMDRDEDDETELQTVSFEISQHSLEKLQKRSVTTSVQYFQLDVLTLLYFISQICYISIYFISFYQQLRTRLPSLRSAARLTPQRTSVTALFDYISAGCSTHCACHH